MQHLRGLFVREMPFYAFQLNAVKACAHVFTCSYGMRIELDGDPNLIRWDNLCAELEHAKLRS